MQPNNMQKISLIFDVPPHLRNAPTALMKELGYGAEYRYAHDEPNAYAAGENYLPPESERYPSIIFQTNRGMEIQIKEKLETFTRAR